MSKVVINIEGMTCNGCKTNIESGINELKGINQVAVSLENNQATVDYDENVLTLTQIEEAIEERGFDIV